MKEIKQINQLICVQNSHASVGIMYLTTDIILFLKSVHDIETTRNKVQIKYPVGSMGILLLALHAPE